jgi:hypothetical protein
MTETAQQLELAFAFGEMISGGPSISLDLDLDRFDILPPETTLDSVELEVARPLSKKELRQQKAKEDRQAALRAKSRVQLRPHANSHRRGTQCSGRTR